MASKLFRSNSVSCIRSFLNNLAIIELQSFSLAPAVTTATQQHHAIVHGNTGRSHDSWIHATRPRCQTVNLWESLNKSTAVARLYHTARQPVAPQPVSGTRVGVYERPARSTVKLPPIKTVDTEKKPVHGATAILQVRRGSLLELCSVYSSQSHKSIFGMSRHSRRLGGLGKRC